MKLTLTRTQVPDFYESNIKSFTCELSEFATVTDLLEAFVGILSAEGYLLEGIENAIADYEYITERSK